eukprot:scaffold650530_cov34-Prasinocladus_malaysianus.AAC.1
MGIKPTNSINLDIWGLRELAQLHLVKWLNSEAWRQGLDEVFGLELGRAALAGLPERAGDPRPGEPVAVCRRRLSLWRASWTEWLQRWTAGLDSCSCDRV